MLRALLDTNQLLRSQTEREYRHGVTSYGAFTYALSLGLRRRRRVSFKRLVEVTAGTLTELGYARRPQMQDEQRQNPIKCGVREWQATSIANMELDPLVATALPCVIDICGRIVDAANAPGFGSLCEQEGQASRSTPDVQHPLVFRDTGKIKK